MGRDGEKAEGMGKAGEKVEGMGRAAEKVEGMGRDAVEAEGMGLFRIKWLWASAAMSHPYLPPLPIRMLENISYFPMCVKKMTEKKVSQSPCLLKC